jgi:hypothetical protein
MKKNFYNFGRKIKYIIIIILIISSYSIVTLVSWDNEIKAAGENLHEYNKGDVENNARSIRDDLEPYIDITVKPNPIIIKSEGEYWINFTFEEFNGCSITVLTVDFVFTNIRGENIYIPDLVYLDDLYVEGGSNATWSCKMHVKSELIIAAHQKGVYRLFLNSTFYCKTQLGNKFSVYTKVPVELEPTVALIVDNKIYSGIKNELNRYCKDVNSKINVDFIECPGTWNSPEALRSYLNNLWLTQNISGAILFGYLPVAKWEFTRDENDNEKCPIPIFYEDLDGSFGDQDADGYYDHHYWGENDGPEIWVSFIMPPIMGQTIPATHLDPYGSLTGGGLQGSYYSDNTMTNSNDTRIDPTIDFDWEENANLNYFPPDNFSVRWTGKIKIDYNETYTFYSEAKGGVKLWIDNVLKIYHPNDKPNYLYQYSNSFYLTAGWHDIKFEYFQNGKGLGIYGMVKLSWSSPTLKIDNIKKFLDKTHLYYTDRLGQPGNALLFMDYAYGVKSRMQEPIQNGHLYPLYGENIAVGGCSENTNATEYLDMLKTGYELVSVWSHAGSTYHHIKPLNDSSAPTSAPYWKIRKRDSGLVTLIWGCHAGDFLHNGDFEKGISKNLVANYAFNTKYGLASAGCTRSYGTTFKQVYHSWQNHSYLGLGYFAFKDAGYDKDYRIQKNPDSGTDKWVEDEVLMGDPFITINHRPYNLELVIEGGRKYTNNQKVTLRLSSENTGEISLRNYGEGWTDWEPFTPVKTWQLPAGPGGKKVEFRMRNSYGSSINTAYDTIGVDTLPPSSASMVINDDEDYTNNSEVNINVEVEDNLQWSCSLSLSNDGETWSPWMKYSPNVAWELSGVDGLKTVLLKVIDGAGNPGPGTSDSIIMDTSNPITRLRINGQGGENGWFTSDVYIELETLYKTDDLDSIKFRINNQSWMGYTQPILINDDGYFTLEYFGMDLYGNQERPNKYTVKIDSNPPVNLSLIINKGKKFTATNDVVLNISSIDDLSGCWMMSLNEDGETWESWIEYIENTSYNFSGDDGLRSLFLQVKDQAGNIADETGFDTIFMDTTKPAVESAVPANNAEDVDVGTKFIISFTETIDEKSLMNSTIYLLDAANEPVSGSILYQKESVIFEPLFPLNYYAAYKLIITNEVKDLAGNYLDGVYYFNYITLGKVPSSIYDLRLRSDGEGVNITWHYPSNTGSGPILGYKIFRKNDQGQQEMMHVTSGNVTYFLDGNLAPNETYYYAISAFNVVGDGPVCDYKSIHFPNHERVFANNLPDGEDKDKNLGNDDSSKNNESSQTDMGVWIILITVIIILISFFIFILKKRKYDKVETDDESLIIYYKQPSQESFKPQTLSETTLFQPPRPQQQQQEHQHLPHVPMALPIKPIAPVALVTPEAPAINNGQVCPNCGNMLSMFPDRSTLCSNCGYIGN